MDCGSARKLIELEIEGALGPVEALELEAHVGGCPPCDSLRADLLTIDRMLLAERLERAPEGFAAAVAARLAVRARRRFFPEPAAVGVASAIGAAGAAYGIAKALRPGTMEPLARWVASVVAKLGEGLRPVAARIPGLDSALWDNPAAAGVLATLAAAGLVFLVVVLVRFPKQMSVEWR